MAKVTMDSSEYESMKSIQVLLEEALVRERDKNKQIEALKQEKIEALERAKHKVITTTKSHSEEVFWVAREPVSKWHLGELETIVRTMVNSYPLSEDHSKWITDFFHKVMEKRTVHNCPKEEFVEEIGIEEFQKKADKKAYARISKEAEEALVENPKLLNENADLNIKFNNAVNHLEKVIEEKLKNEEALKQVLTDNEDFPFYHDIVKSLRHYFSKNNYNVLTYVTFIEDVKEIVAHPHKYVKLIETNKTDLIK